MAAAAVFQPATSVHPLGDVDSFPVIGPPKIDLPNGAVPCRIEIRDLKKDKLKWNLYMLGLSSFYAVDQKADIGYYEVAGIHGRPNREWGGAKGSAHTEGTSKWGGYCTHTSILFASWHRPYVLLLEQCVYDHVQAIAAMFPPETRDKYIEAAKDFRLPYWDWAKLPPKGEANLPAFIGADKTCSVITPTSCGKEVQIPNPLYSYKFAQVNPTPGDFVELNGACYDKWTQTIRYPHPNNKDPNATSNDEETFIAMANEYQGLRAQIIVLMNDPNYKDYAAFVNHQYDPKMAGKDDGSFASIEDVHNSIHGLMGGDEGHMAELDYASFDPSFWLHHTNIDRLFAIWQALNPNSYAIDKIAGDGSYVNPSTTQYTNTTPLTPFYDATGKKYLTSDDVRDTTKLNYAYPETQKWKYSNEKEYQDDLKATVNGLYGGSIADLLAAQTPKANIPKIAPGKAAPIQRHPLSGLLGGEKGIGSHKTIASLVGNNSPFKVGAQLSAKGAKLTALGVDLNVSNPIQGLLGKAKDTVSSSSSSSSSGKATGYTEYIVNIKALKHSVKQTYRVHVFLGQQGSDNKSYHADPTLAGSVIVFGKDPEETGCAKCIKDADADVMVTGTVPLTQGLLEIFMSEANTTLRSLQKDDTLPWLRTNLHWRVTGADGNELDRTGVTGLMISVVTTEIKVETPKGLKNPVPIYDGNYTIQPECTRGRPAGYTERGPH